MTSPPAVRLLAAILSMTCSLPAEVRTDFDPAADFGRFKTYSFVRALELEKTGILNDQETRDRIRNFIAGGLDPRGLKEVPRDQHYDLAIRYWVALRDKQSVSVSLEPDPMFLGWGGYPPYWTGPWSYYYEEYVVHNYQEGTLIVDLIDPATKDLVWRTFFRQDLSDRVKAYDKLKQDLAKSFAKFPPSAKDKKQMERERQKLASKSR